jgi:murein L,D-transpeptidase YcbB/YkuD
MTARLSPGLAHLALLFICCAAGADQPTAGAVPSAMHHYALLESALLKYQGLAREPALTQLPPLPGRAVQPGEIYAGAAALQRLLSAVGDLPAVAGMESNPATLDASLVVALKRFQERHGLEQDGILGPATWRALTTPMAARVHQIEATLARWRSLPPNPYGRAIFINIPRFRLYAMEGMDDFEADLLQMDVVVGRTVAERRTPVFSADLTHLIFRPYWDVPRSIAVNEILPAARRDPTYFTRKDFELVDASGNVVAHPELQLSALASGAVRVRQRPGENNALGAVKFMLPNANNVYLHDTPDKQLFARQTRAFSHGCIRVSEPAALAQWLLKNDPAWSAELIAAAMSRNEPLQVNLSEPVRVYIVYGTAIARQDGTVLFLDDLYGLDKGWVRVVQRRAARSLPSG